MSTEIVLMSVFFFTLGSCIGSFLNVVIDRIPLGLPLTGRSHCDHCQKRLTAKELIPILSFIWQRGRCENCKAKLSWQYPLVELTAGLLFVISFFKLPTANHQLLITLFLSSSLLTLAIIDLKTSLLPDQITLPTIAINLIFLLLTGQLSPIILITAAGSALFFWIIVFLTHGRGMGEGDIRLGFLMGLILGWPKTLIALYLAFFIGAALALILIAGRKKQFGQTIPFGPFLILATFMMMFWGEKIQVLWLKIFGF